MFVSNEHVTAITVSVGVVECDQILGVDVDK